MTNEQDQQLVQQLLSSGVDFPRGKTSAAVTKQKSRAEDHKEQGLRFAVEESAQEEQQLFAESAEEVLTRGKKRKSKVSASNASEAAVKHAKRTKTTQPGVGGGPSVVPSLKYRNLVVGMDVLGCVKEIHDLELVVSLPNNLTGAIAITEISKAVTKLVEHVAAQEEHENEQDPMELPDLSKLFTVGQWLRCVIVELSGGTAEQQKGKDAPSRKSIELSILPERVNAGLSSEDLSAGMILQATLESEEDHGYIVDLGIPNVRGFLNHSKIAMDAKTGLPCGTTLQCHIQDIKMNGKLVQLACDPAHVSTHVLTDDDDSVTMQHLKPGALVQAKIQTVLPTGLWLKLFDLFDAGADWNHSICATDADSLEEGFKVGQKVVARVLFAYPSSADSNIHVTSKHKLGLSLKPELVQWKSSQQPAEFPVGAIIDDITVERVDQGLGLTVVLPASSEDSPIQRGFVHISRVEDNRTEGLESKTKLKAGTQHRARVIGYDYVDGVVQLSMQASVLNAPFFRHQDVKAGEVIPEATILKVDGTIGHLIVQLSEATGIRAICTKHHLSDLPLLSKMEKRFRVGQKIKVRVLFSDPETRKIAVTHKKTLVNSSLPILDSIETAARWIQEAPADGAWCHGVITSVRSFGCIVTFFNNVHGLVHISDLSEQYITNPSESFTAGQLVKCRLVSADMAAQKLTLSLKPVSTKDKNKRTVKQMSAVIPAGHIVHDLEVETVVPEKQYAILRFSFEGQECRAVILAEHLADHGASASFARLRAGMKLASAMVLAVDREGIHVTTKPMLMGARMEDAEAAPKFPSKMEDIQPSDYVIGHIRHVDDKIGAFVGFGTDLCGLVYKKNLSDEFVARCQDFVRVGQTVVALVKEVDAAHKRISLSIKASEMDPAILARFRRMNLESYRDNEYAVTESVEFDWAKFGVGRTAKMTVASVLNNVGFLLKSADGVEGLLTNAQMEGIVKVGDTINVRIMDVDPVKRIVDVTNRAAWMSSKVSKKTKKEVKGAAQEFTVLLVKDDYLVLGAPSHPNGFAYALTKDINDERKSFSRFSVDQKVSGAIVSSPTRAVEEAKPDGRIWVLLEHRPSKDAKFSKNSSQPSCTSVDGVVRSLNDFQVGLKTRGTIKSIKGTQVNVILVRADPTANPPVPAISGRVHISEVIDDLQEIPLEKRSSNLFEALGYKHGSTIDVAVIGFHDAKTHKWLPISHMTGGRTVVELSVRKSILSSDLVENEKRIVQVSDLEIDQQLNGYVNEINMQTMTAWIMLGCHVSARMNLLELSSDPEVIMNAEKNFPIGMALRVCVTSRNVERNTVNVTVATGEPETGKTIPTETIVAARVVKINPENGLSLQTSYRGKQVFGHAALTDLSDELKENPTQAFKTDQIVKCCVLSGNDKRIEFSLRASRTDGTTAMDREIQKIGDVEEGQALKGYIKNIADGGLFVSLGRAVTARVRIAELFDEFVKEWKPRFSVGQLVSGRVKHVDKESGHVELSLKPSFVNPESYLAKNEEGSLRLEHLEKGQIVTGTIARVEKYGVFVDLDNTKGFGRQARLRGMCHRKELADQEVANINNLYSVGDRVKAMVLAIDVPEKKINLGLKSSYFPEEEFSEESSDEDEDNEMMSVEGGSSESDEEEELMHGAPENDSDGAISDDDSEVDSQAESAADGNTSDEDGDNMAIDENVQCEQASPLEASAGFQWNETDWKPVLEERQDNAEASDNDSSEDDAENDGTTKKKSKRAKARAKREEEERIFRAEQEAAAGPTVPETAEDFDRLLLGSPNSSFLWIQYMAFYVNMVEIEKARGIAERALKTIHFREEKEKFNVWIAFLNLENKFGSPASLDAVFKRAILYNEPKHVYLALAKIYEKTEKMEEAEELYRAVLKKFKSSCKVWVQCGLFYFFRKNLEQARETLKRSLVSLPKRKHIKTITKFAQFEYKFGDVERGRTIFEGIMNNYPKRVDLWSVYLDMEIRTKELGMIRRLFERIIHMKFSSKKMKFFFKRYLEFEKANGDDNKVNHVVEEARKYVQSVASEGVGH